MNVRDRSPSFFWYPWNASIQNNSCIFSTVSGDKIQPWTVSTHLHQRIMGRILVGIRFHDNCRVSRLLSVVILYIYLFNLLTRSLTVLRYGDRSPRSFMGRSFAVFWILLGICIVSIFTATLTTSLTAITMDTKKLITGSKVNKSANGATNFVK